ncbi:MAG: DNA-directed RNA polymerase subunit omega [Oscillospiraceae bacterium]|nr:DNA-directed RNA polymerase subunit omega [Oscillospiraceae bacterium]
MLEPSIAQMMQSVNNRYLLVNVVAQRTRDIAEDAREEGVFLEEKPLSIAIREVAEGRIQASV